MTPNDDTNRTDRIVVGTMSASAIVACLVATVLVVAQKLHLQLTYRLSLYQVLSSLLFAVTCALQLPFMSYEQKSYMKNRSDRILCTIVACTNMYTSFLKLCFTACVTCHLFYFAVFYKNYRKLEKWYVGVSLILPLIPSAIPFATNTYGRLHTGCWMVSNNSTLSQTASMVQMIALWYAPTSLLCIVDVVMVTVTLTTLAYRTWYHSNAAREELYRTALCEIMPLFSYPLLSVIFLAIPMAKGYYNFARPHYYFSKPLLVIQQISLPLWGLSAPAALLMHLCVLQIIRRKKRRFRDYRGRQTMYGVVN